MSSGSFSDGVLGGLGLFLLGAWLALEGLAAVVVPWIKAQLARQSRERERAWLVGALLALAAPLSESSARALCGIANASIVPLRTSLWIAAGHTAGVAGAAWLFTLLARNNTGDALALALVAGGVAARWSGPERLRGAVGRALAGWGLLIFGLGLLADGFEAGRGVVRLDSFGGGFAVRTLAMFIVGLSFTAFLRSAGATVALAVAAASGGVLETTSAMAVALGALVGAAWGGLLAFETGTSVARRAALGTIALHGTAALGGMSVLACSLPLLADPPGAFKDPGLVCALLLTFAPAAPALVLLAADSLLAQRLERLFQGKQRESIDVQHVDANLDALPELGLDALVAEATRMQALARQIAASVLKGEQQSERRRESDRAALRSLYAAVEQGSTALARRPLPRRAAEALPALARAMQSIWDLGEHAAWLREQGLTAESGLSAALEARVVRMQIDLARLLEDPDALGPTFYAPACEERVADLERRMGELRTGAVARCAEGEVAPADLGRSLERLAALWRVAELGFESASELSRARGDAEVEAAPEPAEAQAAEAPAAA
jgi:phosphate:Na+ symporter